MHRGASFSVLLAMFVYQVCATYTEYATLNAWSAVSSSHDFPLALHVPDQYLPFNGSRYTNEMSYQARNYSWLDSTAIGGFNYVYTSLGEVLVTATAGSDFHFSQFTSDINALYVTIYASDGSGNAVSGATITPIITSLCGKISRGTVLTSSADGTVYAMSETDGVVDVLFQVDSTNHITVANISVSNVNGTAACVTSAPSFTESTSSDYYTMGSTVVFFPPEAAVGQSLAQYTFESDDVHATLSVVGKFTVAEAPGTGQFLYLADDHYATFNFTDISSNINGAQFFIGAAYANGTQAYREETEYIVPIITTTAGLTIAGTPFTTDSANFGFKYDGGIQSISLVSSTDLYLSLYEVHFGYLDSSTSVTGSESDVVVTSSSGSSTSTSSSVASSGSASSSTTSSDSTSSSTDSSGSASSSVASSGSTSSSTTSSGSASSSTTSSGSASSSTTSSNSTSSSTTSSGSASSSTTSSDSTSNSTDSSDSGSSTGTSTFNFAADVVQPTTATLPPGTNNVPVEAVNADGATVTVGVFAVSSDGAVTIVIDAVASSSYPTNLSSLVGGDNATVANAVSFSSNSTVAFTWSFTIDVSIGNEVFCFSLAVDEGSSKRSLLASSPQVRALGRATVDQDGNTSLNATNSGQNNYYAVQTVSTTTTSTSSSSASTSTTSTTESDIHGGASAKSLSAIVATLVMILSLAV